MQRTISVMAICVSAAIGVPAQTPTFTRNVAPILQQNCQSCHRPGEAAPFSLLTYEQARPWAKAIKAAVLQKKMPPWFADPCCGHFANDPSLSPQQLATIADWVKAGTPAGDEKDAPPAPRWACPRAASRRARRAATA